MQMSGQVQCKWVVGRVQLPKKHIQIDNDDFHLDLLFYNRKLRRLVGKRPAKSPTKLQQ
jgi:hypothetical protein